MWVFNSEIHMETLDSLETSPIISATQLARRWSKHGSTIAAWVKAGGIKPVLRAGTQMSFAMSDVLRIEGGWSMEDADHDVTIPAMTTSDRTNPTVLLRRIGLATQALDAALACQRDGGVRVPILACSNLLLVSAAIRCQVSGGEATHDLPLASFGPNESQGTCSDDSESPAELAELAYAALSHLLVGSKPRGVLSDLGPRGKRAFFESLEQLEVRISEISTQ
jgi:hypothetical protein